MYYVQSVENQLKAIVPTNSDTHTIKYDENFTISDNALRRVVWKVSKVENTTTFGLTKLTFTQELEHAPVDNVSWINFASNNFTDQNTGADYDYYKVRTNDSDKHFPADLEALDESVISYTGVAPIMKTGGSYKTFTANLYANGELISSKPYWSIEYYQNDSLICNVEFMYVNGKLVCNNSDDEFIIDKNKIIYANDKEKLFGIQYLYDEEKPNNLRIKCLQIMNMLGGILAIKASSNLVDDSSSATLYVEVEGL